MSKGNELITKAAAILLMLIGLVAMIVAWDLLLVAGIYTSTVIVLEMGGVIVCLVGYFLWRKTRKAEVSSD